MATVLLVLWLALPILAFLMLYSYPSLVEKRLTKRLLKHAEYLNIPVTFHDSLGDAAGMIIYNPNPVFHNPRIQIMKRFSNEPWVLAHELGHYYAITTVGDESEQIADKTARLICETNLNWIDKKFMELAMQCYFDHK